MEEEARDSLIKGGKAQKSGKGAMATEFVQSRDSAKRSLQNSVWTCHSVGSYTRKPMTAATFSANGYVLLLWKLLSQYGIQRRLS